MLKLRTLLAAAGFSCVTMGASFSAADEPLNLDYSPWTRTCRPDPGNGGHLACITMSSGRFLSAKDTDASTFSALVMQQETDTSKVLRLFAPLGMQLNHGTRLLIDNAIKGQQPYVDCFGSGCFSDYPLDDDMLGLTRAKTLTIQAINANGAPLTLSIPLAGFVRSFEGEATDPTTLDDRDAKRIDAMLALKWDAERVNLTPSLHYAPWTKFCLTGKEGNRVCFVGQDGRTGAGVPLIAAIAIIPDGDPKKLLRITVPLGEQLSSPVTLAIDDQPPSNAPYVVCFANGCMADTALPDAMIDSLRKAKRLTLRFKNSVGRTVARTLPMEDFRKAFDGPPTDPKVFQAGQKK